MTSQFLLILGIGLLGVSSLCVTALLDATKLSVIADYIRRISPELSETEEQDLVDAVLPSLVVLACAGVACIGLFIWQLYAPGQSLPRANTALLGISAGYLTSFCLTYWWVMSSGSESVRELGSFIVEASTKSMIVVSALTTLLLLTAFAACDSSQFWWLLGCMTTGVIIDRLLSGDLTRVKLFFLMKSYEKNREELNRELERHQLTTEMIRKYREQLRASKSKGDGEGAPSDEEE